jgi:hypothetical protein
MRVGAHHGCRTDAHSRQGCRTLPPRLPHDPTSAAARSHHGCRTDARSRRSCRTIVPPPSPIPPLAQADNYEVRYYVSQAAYKSAPDKPKGTINLCWYKVSPRGDGRGARESPLAQPAAPHATTQVIRCTKAEDVAAYGEFSVKLSPWWGSDRRRTWFLRADDEEGLKTWIGALEVRRSGVKGGGGGQVHNSMRPVAPPPPRLPAACAGGRQQGGGPHGR